MKKDIDEVIKDISDLYTESTRLRDESRVLAKKMNKISKEHFGIEENMLLTPLKLINLVRRMTKK